MPRERSTSGNPISTRKWAYAEYAFQHADRAIEVEIVEDGESESARIMAADKTLDRELDKAPHDAANAAAICEAVRRPTMRFVPVKSAEQQA